MVDYPTVPKKKHTVFWIIFPIVMAIITAIVIFYYDLANGPLIWFIVQLIIIGAFVTVRIIFRNEKFFVRLLIWIGFITMTVGCVLFDNPIIERKSAAYYSNPVKMDTPIQLACGKVRGIYNKDQTVQIYAGIPYAKANRWEEPEPYTWEGEIDGSYFGPRSMQPSPSPVKDTLVDIYSEGAWRPNYIPTPYQDMSENGLYLNIWKPNNNETNLPVLVYIHGGSLTSGSSAYEDYNGESMAKKNVIMVTIQYRLGIFGYFAHPKLKEDSPHHTTGNYGLLDQIEALKWIHNYISDFNGDPNNVTIAGESAGSSSVSALCTSPLAAGLFKRAIGESSSLAIKLPPHTYRTEEDAYKTSVAILKEFHCNTVADLKKVSADRLINTKYENSGMMLDGYALTKDPYQVYLDGENNEEALLNGYNVKEADAFVIPNFLFNPTNASNIKSRLVDYFDQTAADEIYNLYKTRIEQDAFTAFNEIISVYWFIMPHHSWSNLMLNNGKTVYRYQFTKENGYHGTYHSGEMIYCYGNLWLSNRQYAYNQSDYDLSETMLNYWANFVKTGNPNGGSLPTWASYSSSTDNVMELGSNVGPIADKYLELYDILDRYIDRKIAAI